MSTPARTRRLAKPLSPANLLALGLPIILMLATGPRARAAGLITETHSFLNVNVAIPDGNPSGYVNVQNFPSAITAIQRVKVTLNITGTWNGDIYAYVQHAGELAVLLNRTGRTGSDAFGYGDDGFQITLDDFALTNIHSYQSVTTPASGSPLTGLWQPDGRRILTVAERDGQSDLYLIDVP